MRALMGRDVMLRDVVGRDVVLREVVGRGPAEGRGVSLGFLCGDR